MELPTITLPRVDTGPFGFGDRLPQPARRAPRQWREWATTLFPAYCTQPFAERHRDLWQWAQALEAEQRAAAFFAIWPREAAKSTSAQMLVVYLGATRKRSYVWYISETQAQADDHVTSLAGMLTTPTVARYYPKLAERRLSKFGYSQGWRRNRLWTAHGLIVDAMGLDRARRGVKLEEKRPDLMVFDDIDNETDTPATVEKKIRTITRKLLPAGTEHLAVLVAQNLVHSGSVVARLVEGHESFLYHRKVSGPYKVIDNLKTAHADGRDVITEGEATWEGQDREYAQRKLDDVGLAAFLAEYQNEVGEDARLIFKPSWWDIATGRNRYRPDDSGLFNRAESRFIFADTSLKDKDTNDPSALMVVDLLPATLGYKLVIREVVEERIQSAFIPNWLEEHARRWNRDGKLKGIIIEDKGSGTNAIQVLRATTPAWLAALIIEFEPQGTKEYRARGASIWCPRDMILLPYPDPSNTAWYAKFINHLEPKGQLFRFPFAPHDDMVDCFSMATDYLHNYLQAGFNARLGAAA